MGQRGRREKFPKDPAGCLKLLFADLDFCCFLVSLVGESEALRIKGNRGPEWSGEEMKKKTKKKKQNEFYCCEVEVGQTVYLFLCPCSS